MTGRRPKDMFDGAIFPTENFGPIEVVEYLTARSIKIRFLRTGGTSWTHASNIRVGSVRDTMQPTIFGVGFIGDGSYLPVRDVSYTEQYRCWRGMIRRVHEESYLRANPQYRECSIHPDFLDLQKFAKWYDENKPDGDDKYELDKDKIKFGNKVYGPDTCTLITHRENLCYRDHGKKGPRTYHGEYVFIDPNGDKIITKDLDRLCSDNNLSRRGMIRIHSGERKKHRGWSKG